MKLEIITPEKTVFAGEVTSVTLPGEGGLFTVWEHHAPLISALAQGKIRFVDAKNEENELQIEGGFAQVQNNKLVVCAEIKE
ncbi:MAG: ATP synthase F1 subunit epsilon [Paludibacter sp.]|jgi:F-type H+-transporting ATPase subunit epsilon|nr:ATP synthase F1 subunit epsilon [Paludibacter sp.]